MGLGGPSFLDVPEMTTMSREVVVDKRRKTTVDTIKFFLMRLKKAFLLIICSKNFHQISSCGRSFKMMMRLAGGIDFMCQIEPDTYISHQGTTGARKVEELGPLMWLVG